MQIIIFQSYKFFKNFILFCQTYNVSNYCFPSILSILVLSSFSSFSVSSPLFLPPPNFTSTSLSLFVSSFSQTTFPFPLSLFPSSILPLFYSFEIIIQKPLFRPFLFPSPLFPFPLISISSFFLLILDLPLFKKVIPLYFSFLSNISSFLSLSSKFISHFFLLPFLLLSIFLLNFYFYSSYFPIIFPIFIVIFFFFFYRFHFQLSQLSFPL